MGKRYVLGVDGGNTKADYLLCTTDGVYVDLLRSPTISHEQMPDGYAGAKRGLAQHVQALLARNGLTISDLDAAAFGLAGADFPHQIEALRQDIAGLGFQRFDLGNDALLGIKALSPNGAGICAVNGTGTVVVGIDETGAFLQVGGVGAYTSDHAGGSFLATRVVSAAYDALMKCGTPTALSDGILQILDIQDPLAYAFAVSEPGAVHRHMRAIIRLTDDAALQGDAVAQRILDTMGEELGLGIAGCIARLSFACTITVVLAGSLWYKLRYQGLMERMRSALAAHCALPFQVLLCQAPPAIGGVFWAIELLGQGSLPPARMRALLDYLTADEYDRIIS